MKGEKWLTGAGMTKKVFCFLIVISFLLSLLGCDMWYKDWKGYMEHWAGTVDVANVQWTSHPESQRNASGQITIPTNGTISTTVNISNPENYTLNLLPGTSHIGGKNEALKSVQVYGDAGNWVRPRAEIISSSSAGFELIIHPISSVPNELSRALEHTDFTVRISPCRSDSGAVATNSQDLVFRYNTPPRTIREVVVATTKYGNVYSWLGATPQMKASDQNTPSWEPTYLPGDDRDGYIFWAWPQYNTGVSDPEYAEKFQIQIDSGEYIDLRLEDCIVPGNPILVGDDGKTYKLYRYKMASGFNLNIRAVDGEGVVGATLGTGVFSYPITIYPTEGSINGSQSERQIHKSGGTAITELDLPNPVHSDPYYSFAGWSTTPGGEAVSFPYTVTGAVDFYALWQQRQEEVLPPSATQGIPLMASDGSYELSTAEHLQWLAIQANNGSRTSINIKLTSDIVVPEGTWTPIYIYDGFGVNFDGQGHSITITEDYSDKVNDTSSYGLFTNANGGLIENLVLKGSLKVNTTGSVGAVAGSIYAGTIRNVMSEMAITNVNTSTQAANHIGTGGLVGFFGGTSKNPTKASIIENCAVYADITSSGYGGGLVGQIWRGQQVCTIKNSLYKGKVTGASGYAGAVIGFNGNEPGYTSNITNVSYCETGSLSVCGGTNGGTLTESNVTDVSEDYFKEPQAVELVNTDLTPPMWEMGANYPVLKQ